MGFIFMTARKAIMEIVSETVKKSAAKTNDQKEIKE